MKSDLIGDFIKQATDLAICVGQYLTALDGDDYDEHDALAHLRIAYERLQEGVRERQEQRAQGGPTHAEVG